MQEPVIREARDEDAEGIIALVGRVFAEYPGMVLAVDEEMPHLRRPASAFRELGGRLWVAEAGAAVVACGGYVSQGDAVELRTLYVDASARRRGLGARICALAEADGRALGCPRFELWTDTRFTDAHRLYERLGFRRQPEERALGDLSNTVEYHFVKPLDPVPEPAR